MQVLRSVARVALLTIIGFTSGWASDSLNIVQLSNVPGGLEDIWGYTDSEGREYALCCTGAGLKIYEITNALSPRLVTEILSVATDLKDVKTHLQYAYCANQRGEMQIIDLGGLPDSAKMVATYDSPTYGGAHNLTIANGYIFVTRNGVQPTDLRILDLADPLNPVEVGSWAHPNPELGFVQSHDAYVNDTICYVSYLGAGWVALSIADITNPTLLAKVIYPGAVNHNIWGDTAGNYIYTTDETGGGHLRIWDISDFNNVTEVAEYNAGPGSIIHNCFVRDNLVYMSYYQHGIRIVDVTNPLMPVEVGAYDTYPQGEGGFGGCWGIYNYFPSGLIIASDLANGLFVLSYNGTGAGFVNGQVIDAVTDFPLEEVAVTALELSSGDLTDGAGNYTLGLLPDTYTLEFSKFGWASDTVVVTIVEGTTSTIDVGLVPLMGATVSGFTGMNSCTDPLIGTALRIIATTDLSAESDISGAYDLGFLPANTYTVTAGRFGRVPADAIITVLPDVDISLSFSLDPGFDDDAEFDQNWDLGVPGDDATEGMWERVEPVASYVGHIEIQPGYDHSPAGSYAFVTGQNNPGGGASDSDVDNGITTLQSPRFSLESFIHPQLSYWRWISNNRGGAPYTDAFIVRVSSDNGASWTDLENTTIPFNAWKKKTFLLEDWLTLTDEMRIQFIAGDTGQISIVEAAVDDISIEETGTRGDFNADGFLTAADIIAGVNYVFKSGPGPDRMARADADGDCDESLADIIFWINRLFKSHPGSGVSCRCSY